MKLPAIIGPFRFKRLGLGAAQEPAAIDDAGDRFVDIGTNWVVSPCKVAEGYPISHSRK